MFPELVLAGGGSTYKIIALYNMKGKTVMATT